MSLNSACILCFFKLITFFTSEKYSFNSFGFSYSALSSVISDSINKFLYLNLLSIIKENLFFDEISTLLILISSYLNLSKLRKFLANIEFSFPISPTTENSF